MLFTLNLGADRPIYAQIGDQVKFAVLAGLLKPGEMIPSVRELSKQLVVNPNTVARAYRDLQGEGILEAVRGTGLLVSSRAKGLCHHDRLEFVRIRLREVFTEVMRLGISAAEVEGVARSEWSALVPGDGKAISTSRVELKGEGS